MIFEKYVACQRGVRKMPLWKRPGNGLYQGGSVTMPLGVS